MKLEHQKITFQGYGEGTVKIQACQKWFMMLCAGDTPRLSKPKRTNDKGTLESSKLYDAKDQHMLNI